MINFIAFLLYVGGFFSAMGSSKRRGENIFYQLLSGFFGPLMWVVICGLKHRRIRRFYFASGGMMK